MNMPRVQVRALIVRYGRLLLTKNSDHNEEFYLLPGAAVEFGETMTEALQRGCREQLGCEVTIEDVAVVRDYRGAQHEFADVEAGQQEVDVMFRCSVPDEVMPEFEGSAEEGWQTGIRWVPTDQLQPVPLYPAALKMWFRTAPADRKVYLGDVN